MAFRGLKVAGIVTEMEQGIDYPQKYTTGKW